MPDFPPPPPPVRDEDAVVAIRDVGSLTGDRSGTGQLGAPNVLVRGQRVHKDQRSSRQPRRLRAGCADGLKREEALVAKTSMGNADPDGEGRGCHVHAGQWVPRSHPAVKVHPTMFEGAPYAPDEAA